MKTKIKKTDKDLVISFTGKINYEIQQPLRNQLIELINQVKTDSAPKNIIFNFEELEFVGSSGITNFVQTLTEFNKSSPIRPRYCHLKSEFKKIITAFDEEEIFDIFENEDKARRSFDN